MTNSSEYKKQYDELKARIIGDIWYVLKEHDGEALDIGETKGCPAIVTQSFDDQESEVIDELIIKNNKVIAVASSYYDDVNEYDIDEFDIPFLIVIYESIEKHIKIEKG